MFRERAEIFRLFFHMWFIYGGLCGGCGVIWYVVI